MTSAVAGDASRAEKSSPGRSAVIALRLSAGGLAKATKVGARPTCEVSARHSRLRF